MIVAEIRRERSVFESMQKDNAMLREQLSREGEAREKLEGVIESQNQVSKRVLVSSNRL